MKLILIKQINESMFNTDEPLVEMPVDFSLDGQQQALLAELIRDWIDLAHETDEMGEPAPEHLKAFAAAVLQKLGQ